jgi:signal transduction histidine kinase
MAVFEERQRIARDLHDSAAQELYGLVTLTGAAQLQLEQGDLTSAAHTLTRIGETGRQAIREMRLFIHHLNPPRLEEEGLVGALHQRLATVEGRADVETRILADNTIALPLPVQRALYQIAQEALNNCLRHARADHITVYLGREHDDVILEVIDDGQGFDTIGLDHPAGGMEAGAGYGMGLKNMRQRAASIEAALTITSSPGYGTRVRVVVHAAEAAGPQGRNHAD